MENEYSNVLVESIDDLFVLFSILSVEKIEQKIAKDFGVFENIKRPNSPVCGPEDNFITFVLQEKT